MRKLTEEQAWEVLRVKFGPRYGLCHAVGQLEGQFLIDRKTANAMHARIERERRRLDSGETYLWPVISVVDDVPRAAFACRSAERAAVCAEQRAARQRAKRKAA